MSVRLNISIFLSFTWFWRSNLLYSTNVGIICGEQAIVGCVARVIAHLLCFLLFRSCWENQSKDEALDPEVNEKLRSRSEESGW